MECERECNVKYFPLSLSSSSIRLVLQQTTIFHNQHIAVECRLDKTFLLSSVALLIFWVQYCILFWCSFTLFFSLIRHFRENILSCQGEFNFDDVTVWMKISMLNWIGKYIACDEKKLANSVHIYLSSFFLFLVL